MLQLSGLDAAFLNMETDTTFSHVSQLMIFKGEGFRGDSPFDAIREHLDKRVHDLPPMYRRLVPVPLNLDRPYWIDGGRVDLDFHCRHIGVPPPGDDAQLCELVARIISRPLDRSRPLWEFYVIEGLASGEVAALVKLHHAAIDGASAMDLYRSLLDSSADGPPHESLPSRPAESQPDALQLLARANLSLLRHPGRALSLQFRAARALGEFFMGSSNDGKRPMLDNAWSRWLNDEPGQLLNSATLTAPRTPLNATISAQRRYAWMHTPLDELKAIKNAAGTTLNDVVMAVCAGALRRYLLRHDALPEDPLIAMIPVSVRTGEETEKYSNQVSGVLSELATDDPDPRSRLQRINRAMASAKELHKAVPASLLQDFSKFASPAVAAQAARTIARWRVADHVAPLCNVVISNVPGPRETLYLAGAELTGMLPVSTIGDGMALNMTVVSYGDRLDWGYVACRERVPDVADLIDDTKAAIEELREAFAS